MPAHDDLSGIGTPPPSRDELVAMIARAHQGSTYGDSTEAGRTLAAQSKLPRKVAENLGAGFGQWDFFPEAAEIVDFACTYEPPATEEDIWTIARAWASDDAASRPTVLALVGREVLQHELRRIDVPKLRELVEETRQTRALALRTSLGLAVPEPRAARREPEPVAPKRKAAASAAAPKREIPTRMPKPTFVRPAPPPAAAPPKRFQHPKFGEGTLASKEGEGPEAKLTIQFDCGTKTLLARYVTEL